MTVQQAFGCFIFVLGFFIGLLIGSCIERSWWKGECVYHHAAHYDERTGKWQWNDEVRP